MPTYSVSFRLQRIVTEEAHIDVAISDDLVIFEPDGTGSLDVDKVFAKAVELGHDPNVVWVNEDLVINVHPIQAPPPNQV